MTKSSKVYFRPKVKYDRNVQVKMTQDDYEYLKLLSKLHNLSISQIIRESLSLYLNNHL